MHITRVVQAAFISGMLISASFATAQVYTWKGQSGSNNYSDVPLNLKPTNSGVVNIRTRTVTQPIPTQEKAEPGSLADKQKELNDAISAENKKVEEQNKKVDEQNRQQKEENCKIARMNRQFAETARIANREAFIARYDEDVAKFCSN